MTDKELLSAFTISPPFQSKNPIIAYAVPLYGDVVQLRKINGQVIKVMTISDLYAWALSNDLSVDAPVLNEKVKYNDSDEKAYIRLMEAEEQKRKAEIEFCMARLKKLLNV